MKKNALWLLSFFLLFSCEQVNDALDSASEEVRNRTENLIEGSLPIKASFTKDPLFHYQWHIWK